MVSANREFLPKAGELMSDYFLIHRALQIQRLCAPGSEHGIELPGRLSRDGLPAAAIAFLRAVDRIRKLPLDEKAPRGLMQLLRLGRTQSASRLTPKQRALILEFERQLVELRLLDDPQANKLAAACIQAILRDRAFFFGLKPLAQHTEDFAHELLYPTWLNLYTAMRLRCGAGQPKFTDEQVKEVVECLRKFESELGQAAQPLQGLLTFVANRFTAEEAVHFARRLARRGARDPASATACIARIDALLQPTPAADELKELIPGFVLVECCLQGESDERPENASRGPFPPVLEDKLQELPQSPETFPAFRQLLLTIAKIVERAGGFDEGLGKLFAAGTYEPFELLDLCLSADAGRPAFSCQVQRLIVRLLELEKPMEPQTPASVRGLAHHLGRRLDCLDPHDLGVFAAEFIEKDRNRAVLLAAAQDGAKRERVAQQLLEATRREKDSDRFFYRLQVAALLGSWQNLAGLENIGRSIKVLQLSRRDDSISLRELTELMDDLRDNLPASLGYLESPGFAGRGKPDRLARLYLSLNEACHLYSATGKAANFGLIRAGYRILDQLAEE